jgi:hypothetical protein
MDIEQIIGCGLQTGGLSDAEIGPLDEICALSDMGAKFVY